MVSRATIGLAIGCVGLVPLACVALGVRVAYRPAQDNSPFGALTASAVDSVAAQERRDAPVKLPQILRLAPRPVETAAASAPVETAPAPLPESRPALVQVSVADGAAAAQEDHQPPPHPVGTEVATALPAADPAEQASAVAEPAAAPAFPSEDSGVSEKPQTPATPAKGSININKASVEALNHLPGAGLIGRANESHRPYRSVQDLVDRKILRFSAFQKVRSRIRVD